MRLTWFRPILAYSPFLALATLTLFGEWPDIATAQNAFWSAEGEFENATDTFELHFEAAQQVSSADIFFGATWSHSGGTNSVGDVIPAGGFDPIVSLFQDLGGAEILHGSNDDGYSAPNRDSLLTWPALSQNGGTIGTDPLSVGDYRMTLTAFESAYPGGTSPWAMDLLGPWLPLTATGLTTSGDASVKSFKFGGSTNGFEEAWFSLDSAIASTTTITERLDVGTHGVGRLFVNAGTTLNTPGIAQVGTIVPAAADGLATIDGTDAIWNAGFLSVGGSGSGFVDVRNQGRLVTDRTNVLRGSVNVGGVASGPAATWEVTDRLLMGSSQPGTGFVRILPSGQLTVTNDLIVGSTGASGQGHLIVDPGGDVDVGGTLSVGSGSTVELFGGEISTTSFTADAGSTFSHTDGTLIVDGGQFTMELGTLTIDEPGTLDTPTLRLENGAQGSVEVNPGVTPQGKEGIIEIAAVGRGRMEIIDGSQLVNSRGQIAWTGPTPANTGQGSVLVEGAGSTWELTSEIDDIFSYSTALGVGGTGNGNLEIRNGGRVVVQKGNAQFGDPLSSWTTSAGSGVGVVDGTDSKLMVVEGSLGIGTFDTLQSPPPVTGELTVSNQGRVEVAGLLLVDRGGTLRLNSRGSIRTRFVSVNDGSWIHEDGTLTVDGGTFNPGTTGYTISGSAQGDEPTLELVNGATASFVDTVQIGATGDAALFVDGPGSSFEATGGIMDIGWIASGRLDVMNGGVVNHTGTFVLNLGVAQNASGIVSVSGIGSQLNTAGLMIVGDHGFGNLVVSGGGSVTANRMWIAHFSDAQPSGVLVSGVPGNPSVLDISGSLYVSGEESQGSGVASILMIESSAQAIVLDTLKVWPAGTARLHQGTISARDVDLEGRLDGIGNVVVGAGLINSGTVAPGFSPGVLTIEGSDYTQTAAGALEIDLGGTATTDFDQLHIARGAANLAGTLEVSLLPGFSPLAGDVFEILTTEDGLNGSFDAELLPMLTGDLMWHVDYDTIGQRVRLQVSTPYSADFDLDGDVDGDDLAKWQSDYGANGDSDADGDGDSDGADLLEWQRQFGSGVGPLGSSQAVPEPTGLALLLLGATSLVGRKWKIL